MIIRKQVLLKQETPKVKKPIRVLKKSVPFDSNKYVDDYDILAKQSLATYSSNMQGGKVRILEFFKSNKNKQERVAFLKKEFGISGSSTVYGFVNYNSTGMIMNIKNSDKDIHIPWGKVADIISELIDERSYFNPMLKEAQ